MYFGFLEYIAMFVRSTPCWLLLRLRFWFYTDFWNMCPECWTCFCGNAGFVYCVISTKFQACVLFLYWRALHPDSSCFWNPQKDSIRTCLKTKTARNTTVAIIFQLPDETFWPTHPTVPFNCCLAAFFFGQIPWTRRFPQWHCKIGTNALGFHFLIIAHEIGFMWKFGLVCFKVIFLPCYLEFLYSGTLLIAPRSRLQAFGLMLVSQDSGSLDRW